VDQEFKDFLLEYLRLLREEILQAQQARRTLVAAKIASLAGLYAYALGLDVDKSAAPEHVPLVLLLGPGIALAFDCMNYGLSYNIHEIGSYIHWRIEAVLPKGPDSAFDYWQTSLSKVRRKSGFMNLDFGRSLSKYGNYLVTVLSAITSFSLTRDMDRTQWSLLLGLAVTCLLILWLFEWRLNTIVGERHRPQEAQGKEHKPTSAASKN
jgi:hypothetical protein